MRYESTSVLEPPARPAAPPVSVDPATRRSLLDIARVALRVATYGADLEAIERALAHAPSHQHGAVFVTLTDAGGLRGCMGSVDPDRDLGEAVAGAALSAALDDPRFLPLIADELPAIHVDVSVLGPASPIDDPGSFRPGIDGVVVERGARVALLLPEVATEFGWDAIEMFDAVCHKGGLRAGAWREPGTRLRAFRTARFGGPAVGPGQTLV